MPPADFPRDVFERLLGFWGTSEEIVRAQDLLDRARDANVKIENPHGGRAFKSSLADRDLAIAHDAARRMWGDTITVIDLGVTGPMGNEVFVPTAVRTLSSEALNGPVDLAPADIETENSNWASNTTLEDDADFYVANRGNNTIVRMRQDGTVVAIRRVSIAGSPLDNASLNGIATSPDGTQIYVTVTGPSRGQGSVLAVPAFDD